MSRTLNVVLIGQKFMGRAHSNAYNAAARFFDLPVKPVLHTIVARDQKSLDEFAGQWGWANATTDWRAAVTGPEADLVDVSTPNNKHRDFVVTALQAGKHVACEKPLAATLEDAKAMCDAAANAPNSKTFVWYNYRRVPAVATAYKLARQGLLGRIYHVNLFYRQGWAASADIPLIWRFDKEQAGSGALGDLGAHIIDMARFVTGDEFAEINGAIMETFIKERTLPTGIGGVGLAAGVTDNAGVDKPIPVSTAKGPVTVDDGVLAIGRMNSGAVFRLEATRFATGRENRNGFEINGDKGSLRFDFEDLNNLYYYNAADPELTRGWTKIQASFPGVHPYQHAYWPTAHPLGYEHAFVNMAADVFRVLGGQAPEVPLPDFADAYQTQRVMEAIERAATQKCGVLLSDIQ